MSNFDCLRGITGFSFVQRTCSLVSYLSNETSHAWKWSSITLDIVNNLRRARTVTFRRLILFHPFHQIIRLPSFYYTYYTTILMCRLILCQLQIHLSISINITCVLKHSLALSLWWTQFCIKAPTIMTDSTCRHSPWHYSQVNFHFMTPISA